MAVGYVAKNRVGMLTLDDSATRNALEPDSWHAIAEAVGAAVDADVPQPIRPRQQLGVSPQP